MSRYQPAKAIEIKGQVSMQALNITKIELMGYLEDNNPGLVLLHYQADNNKYFLSYKDSQGVGHYLPIKKPVAKNLKAMIEAIREEDRSKPENPPTLKQAVTQAMFEEWQRMQLLEAQRQPQRPADLKSREAKPVPVNISSLPGERIRDISAFLTAQELVQLSSASKKLAKLVQESRLWEEKIAADFFGYQFPAIDPKLLLPGATAYHHLEIWSRLPSWKKIKYAASDPALFQVALVGDLKEVDLWVCFQKAVQVGNLRLVQWLMSAAGGNLQFHPDSNTLNRAASSGNLALVQWLMAAQRGAQRFHPDSNTLSDAASSGNLALVRWLMSAEQSGPQLRPGPDMLNWAARSGNLTLVQWLVSPDQGGQRLHAGQQTLYHAARSGSLTLVQWLVSWDRGDQRLRPDQDTLNAAARSRCLELVQWLMSWPRGDQQLHPDQETLHHAARSGDLALVQWLVSWPRGDQQLHPDQETLHHAARSGDLALVQWLVSWDRGDQQLRPDQETLHHAVGSGNLTLVQWLVSRHRGDQQLHPDQETLHYAARSGNLTLVQWLTAPDRGEDQLHPHQGVLLSAARSGNLMMVQWLTSVDRGDQQLRPDQDVLYAAASSGCLMMVQWLVSRDRGDFQLHLDQPTLENAARSVSRGDSERGLVEWISQQLSLPAVAATSAADAKQPDSAAALPADAMSSLADHKGAVADLAELEFEKLSVEFKTFLEGVTPQNERENPGKTPQAYWDDPAPPQDDKPLSPEDRANQKIKIRRELAEKYLESSRGSQRPGASSRVAPSLALFSASSSAPVPELSSAGAARSPKPRPE